MALGRGAGQFGVMIFFLLSAFLISYLYLDTPPTPRLFSNYAIARIARVIPLYLIVVLISFGISRYFHKPLSNFVFDISSIKSLLSHLLLLRGTNLLWTIPTEIHFYLLFALAWIFWPSQKTGVYLIVAILIVTSIFFGKYAVSPVTVFGLVATPLIAFVFPYFAVGFLLGPLYRRWQPNTRWCSHYYVFALFIIPLLYPVILFNLTGQHHQMWEDVRILVCVCAVFFVVVFLVPEKNWLLENRAGDLLGKISYSLYLLHLPLLLMLKSFGLATGIGGLALFLALAVALSYVSYIALELPMRKGIKSLYKTNSRLREAPIDAR